jgi:hypothetical protein
MENKELDLKISEIIFPNQEENENTIEPEIVIKVKDGLFEHNEIINKKFVTTDGRQLLKEIRFES